VVGGGLDDDDDFLQANEPPTTSAAHARTVEVLERVCMSGKPFLFLCPSAFWDPERARDVTRRAVE
jgi:hypothetical protein